MPVYGVYLNGKLIDKVWSKGPTTAAEVKAHAIRVDHHSKSITVRKLKATSSAPKKHSRSSKRRSAAKVLSTPSRYVLVVPKPVVIKRKKKLFGLF